MENPKRCLRHLGAVLPKAWSRGLASGIAALFAVSIAGSASAEVTLRYSDHDPAGAMRTGFNKDVWLPEIEKQTGGEVKIGPQHLQPVPPRASKIR